MSKRVRGAFGGGGKKPRAPVEASDTLRSIQYARVVDVVSEGEIEGLVNGLASVYLDDTPVAESDGTLNFTGVTVVTRNGTQAQDYVEGFSAVESEIGVNTEVGFGAPVTRTVTTTNVNAVRVTVGIPALVSQNGQTGDIGGTSVTIGIEVQSNGGGYVPQRISAVSSALSVSGANASSGTSEIFAATVTVEWVGVTTTADLQVAAWRLEYKKAGGAWTQFATGTFSGSRRQETTGGFGTAPTTVTVPPSDTATRSVELAEGAYEFRVVKVSGTGTLTIKSGSGTRWSSQDTISGKTTTRYQRSYRIPLTGSPPWDIRVSRVSPDSTSSLLQNATFWDSYTEIIDAKLRYPNTALVALSVDAEQFNSVPRRGYDIKGLKVRVPSNYDTVTRTYSGAWDGTFKVEWTDNPAWCFYDILIEGRYGLGDFIDADQVDKWALYSIAQYCDEPVPNGFGGTEPRFTCNLYLQSRDEAYNVINAMASIFRGMVYWSAGSLTASQDKPGDPVALFTPANVIGGQFNYEGSAAKARHTVALVGWNDPADRYQLKVEYVEDEDGIERFGVIQTELVAVGCTSRAQAHRVGRWLLYTERLESETVTFRTGLDGLMVAPGDIIQTSDPVRAGERRGGRVTSATTTSVTLDAAVTLGAGKTYTLSARLPDGTVESRAVTSAAGSRTTLTVSPAYSTAPQAGAIWVLASADLIAEAWRVISVLEVDGSQAEVVALSYRPDKYDAVEQDLILEPLPTSGLTATPAPPVGLQVSESLYYISPAVVGARVTLSWSSDAPFYEVQWRVAEGNWQTAETTLPSFDIQPAQPGQYEFRVYAVNAIGRRSQPGILNAELYGLSAPPVNVENFQLAPLGTLALLTWSAATDLDVLVGGALEVRHAADPDADWDAASVLTEVAGTSTSATVPLLAGRYLARWRDAGGVLSAQATSIVTNAPQLIELNVVEVVAGHPNWTGTKTGTHYMPDAQALVLSSSDLWDSTQLLDAADFVDYGGGVATSGAYALGTIDLGTTETVRLSSAVSAVGVDLGGLWDSAELMDSTQLVDGGVITGVTAEVWVRQTTGNPAGSPTWSAWRKATAQDATARAWQFELRLTSPGFGYNIQVSEASAQVDMPDRIESGDDIVSGAGSYAVTYSRPFRVVPSLSVTAQNMATGDYYEVSGKTASGFSVVFKDSTGTPVSRTFDYIARAY